jgi:hypothetical protein
MSVRDWISATANGDRLTRSARKRAVACVAAVTLAGAAVVAMTSAPAAHAATLDCGYSCTDWFYQGAGNADIIEVDSGTAQVGQGTTVATAGNYSAEDFKLDSQALVSTYYSDGIVNAIVGLHWGNDYAFEIQYAPSGQESGLCLGVASVASPGEDVTLQPCGVDANTLWIELAADQSDGYEPLISATDTSVTAPEVLTVGLVFHGYPPSVSVLLEVAALYQFDGAWSTSQMWADETGPTGHIIYP